MRALWLSLALLSAACPAAPPDEPPVFGGSFSTSEDINGLNPEPATEVIFGQLIDRDGSLTGRVSASISLFASDRADLCALFEARGQNLIDDIDAGTVEGRFVVFFYGELRIPEDGDLVESGTPGVLLESAFLVGDGAQLLLQAVDQQSASQLLLERLEEGVSFKGSFSAALDLEQVTQSPIDTLLEGSFTAKHCQALSDTLE